MIAMCRQAVSILLISTVLAACSTPGPVLRGRIAPIVDELSKQDAAVLFPREYRTLLELFEHGEALYHVREDDKGADVYYQLALQNAYKIKTDLEMLQKRRAAEEMQRLTELAAKAEEEKFMRAAIEAEQRVLSQQTDQKIQNVTKESPPVLSTIYTVRRGETLPQISARTEIYNDASLWPLIYRSNRDQIRDPKRLWPGQRLKIPRKFSRDEAVEARRYSNKNN